MVVLSILLILIAFTVLIMTIIGLINPAAFNKHNKGEAMTRRTILTGGVGSTLFLLFVVVVISMFTSSPESSKENQSVVAAKKWYQGGTLYNENGIAWQSATAENKLATCADIVAVMYEKKMFVEPINSAVHTVEDFKPLAEELMKALDGAFKKDPDAEKNNMLYTNQKVSDTSVILATMMGWIN